jgi:hypothetical protein
MIDRWASTISKRGLANLDRTLEHLCVQEKTEWSRPHASPLKNSIYVIRFKDENRTQHRIFGHFHGSSNVFVLSQTGIEKDGNYSPTNYLALAESHKLTCDAQLFDRTTECFYLDIHRSEDASRGGPSRVHFDVPVGIPSPCEKVA